MPLPTKLAFAVGVALLATLAASPTVASGAPTPPPAGPQAPVRTGDQLFVPGVQPGFDHKSTTKHTQDVGAGTGTVEKVWVSVASATTSSKDDVHTTMTQSAVETLIGQLNSYWSAQSEGAVSVVFGGYETRSVGESSCAPNSVLASEAQKAFGGMFASNAWIGSHAHLLVLTRESCGDQSFATVGGNGGEIFSGNGISTSLGMPYLLHEFGHNLGFEHADASICENTSTYDAAIAGFGFTSTTCPTTEYDDFLDIMGYTVKSATPNLSSPQRILAGWLTGYTTATNSTPTRTITLSALGGSTGTRAIRIVDPISGELYYVEYRARTGRDKTSAEFRYQQQCGSSHSGYEICNLGNSTSNGIVRILRSLPFPADNATGTTVLATNLLSGSTNEKKRHTRMSTGKTFVNFDSGFSVKLNSVSASAGASVTVSFVFPASTTTRVAIDPTTQLYGSGSAATVSVATTAGAPGTGTVAIYDGKTKLGSAPLDGTGDANFTLPGNLAVGKHSITARFTPTVTTQKSSTSSAASVTVTKVPSSVTIVSSAATVSSGHGEVITVTVIAAGIANPTGTLTVYSNGKKITSGTLKNTQKGTRTLSLPKFSSRGARALTVHYGGSPHAGSSVSVVATTTVV